MISCDKSCMRCKEPQRYKINYSRYHGVCEAHKILNQADLQCIFCHSKAKILFFDPMAPACDYCLQGFGEKLTCGHSICKDCVIVLNCEICNHKSELKLKKYESDLSLPNCLSKKPDIQFRNFHLKSECSHCLDLAEQDRKGITEFQCFLCTEVGCPICRVSRGQSLLRNSPENFVKIEKVSDETQTETFEDIEIVSINNKKLKRHLEKESTNPSLRNSSEAPSIAPIHIPNKTSSNPSHYSNNSMIDRRPESNRKAKGDYKGGESCKHCILH